MNQRTFLVGAALLASAAPAFGQQTTRPGKVIIPDTNIERTTDIGVRAHTNYRIFVPAAKQFTGTSPSGETPGSIACIYRTSSASLSSGCPTSTSTLPSGGSGIIAIVDAYDYPTACSDFDTFSNQFGLPIGNNCANGRFTKVYATGNKPRANSGWALEAALDIEWTHAMAPSAKIALVEAASNRFTDLLDAVSVASNMVSANGGKGEVSMSWGGSEFSGETDYDSYFTVQNVVYTAASGDSGGSPIWPSTSPNVVSCGGTTINRDSAGDFTGETAWTSSGGGDSVYEEVPTYQSAVSSVSDLVGGFRGTPDFSFDADPNSGVSVYDSTPYEGLKGWSVIGGTSASAQGLAGIINWAGHFYASSFDELATIYDAYDSNSYDLDFRDITSGSTSGCSGHRKSSTCYSASSGWDFVSGVGSDLGKSGK